MRMTLIFTRLLIGLALALVTLAIVACMLWSGKPDEALGYGLILGFVSGVVLPDADTLRVIVLALNDKG